jgi:Tfp pilus assembly protein PilX
MLKMDAPRTPARHAQRGVVMIMALIVLVAITVAAIALTRSVDTATLIAGNLAFKKSATRAADKGIEQAVAVLKQKAIDGTLDSNDPASGYFATFRSLDDSPPYGTTWQSFWSTHYSAASYAMDADQFGNQVSFVINRECANAAPPGAGGQCVASPAVTVVAGNSQEAGEIQLASSSQIYYRITVRVSGPRRTESYVQSHIAM